MRKLVIAGVAALTLAVAAVPAASANPSPPLSGGKSPRLSMTAKITHFRATKSGNVVANGVLSGKLSSGNNVSTANAPVKFAVVAAAHGGQCKVITLRLAPLSLELLGVHVTTSAISLDVNAVRGAVLGNLFCSLAHANVTLPRAARVAHALNSRLGGQSLRVFRASQSLDARAAQAQPQSCQVLQLVLGPLHLNLLGLVVDLYGQTPSDPVTISITAVPSEGLLGQLLCGVAGGGVTDVAGLQSLLGGLGVNLSPTQVQNLLTQLGISNLSGGLTQLQLNQILKALGLGGVLPPAI
jgi:hypothetical protein